MRMQCTTSQSNAKLSQIRLHSGFGAGPHSATPMRPLYCLSVGICFLKFTICNLERSSLVMSDQYYCGHNILFGPNAIRKCTKS